MKPRFTLPFIALIAWLGAQSEASAINVSFPSPLSIPPAAGLILLGPCDAVVVADTGNCGSGGNTQITFPPNTATATATSGASSSSGSITYQASSSPSTVVSSMSAVLDASEAGSTAELLLTYFFGVAVRPGLTLLDAKINVNTIGMASVTPNTNNGSSAYVSVQIQRDGSPLGSLLSEYACTAPCPNGLTAQNSFSTSQNIPVSANVLYSVSMSIALTVDGVAFASGFAKALGSIDPVITIDPTEANDFQLVVSNTPVPSTWITMLSGLIGVGFFAYRGRRTRKGAPAIAAV
jgi:hypothetical protein